MMSEDVVDLAIAITDRLVEMGVVRDCIDTDEPDEFTVQDAVTQVIEDFLVGLD